MFGAHYEPLRRGVGMMGVHVGFQGAQLRLQKLETKSEFRAPLDLSLPTKMRHDGAVDLYARGEMALDNLGGQLFGRGGSGDGGPGDEHRSEVRTGAGWRQAGKPRS